MGARSSAKRHSVATVRIHRWRLGDKPRPQADAVAREEPLEIRVRGRSVAVTMRTPGNDRELAAGFLLTEGIVRSARDIVSIAPCRGSSSPENTLNVFLARGVTVNFDQLTRHVFASSSCGLCGKASIDSVRQQFPPVTAKLQLDAAILAKLPAKMRTAQAAFAQTGGLHAAALFDLSGKLLLLREDVGRHNAVDKVLGAALLGKLPIAKTLLLVSGRASFEIMQKSLAGGIPIVCAVSAPSSLAIEFARESNQTLVGFLRGDTMNIYSGCTRLITALQRKPRRSGWSQGNIRSPNSNPARARP